MALSAQEKAKVVFYLGWSGLTIVTGSTQFNSVVNDRLNDSSDDGPIESRTRELLERLEGYDECLDEAKCRLSASKVQDITMNKDEIAQILKERKRVIRELSDHLDIPIVKSNSSMPSVKT